LKQRQVLTDKNSPWKFSVKIVELRLKIPQEISQVPTRSDEFLSNFNYSTNGYNIRALFVIRESLFAETVWFFAVKPL
jgi:hypothetical protein